MNPVIPVTQLTSSEIAHDVFVAAAMAVPVLLLVHDHPILALLVGGFEYAVFYSLGGPRFTI